MAFFTPERLARSGYAALYALLWGLGMSVLFLAIGAFWIGGFVVAVGAPAAGLSARRNARRELRRRAAEEEREDEPPAVDGEYRIARPPGDGPGPSL